MNTTAFLFYLWMLSLSALAGMVFLVGLIVLGGFLVSLIGWAWLSTIILLVGLYCIGGWVYFFKTYH